MRRKIGVAGLIAVLALSALPVMGVVSAQDDEASHCDADWFTVAADTIGVDADALQAALADGQTIAEVAEANDADPETVVDAIINGYLACVDDLAPSIARRFRNSVENMAMDLVYGQETGIMRFGQGPHMEWEGSIREIVPDVLEALPLDELRDMMPMGEMMPLMPAVRHDWLETAAEAIGIDTDALLEAVRDGQTIAEIAEANDVELQTVVDAIVAAETEALGEQVKTFVNEAHDMPMLRFGMGQQGRMGPRALPFDDSDTVRPMIEAFMGWSSNWLETAAETIGIDADELTEALADGQTIAEVAEANDVEPQAVIDAIVAAETETLQARVQAFVESDMPFLGKLELRFGPRGGMEWQDEMPRSQGPRTQPHRSW